MKILVACHRIDEIAGSELYHYELCKELVKQGQQVTLATYIPIDSEHSSAKSYPLVTNLVEQGVRIIPLQQLAVELVDYDLAVVSQPHVTEHVCKVFPTLNKVSIIHSPYRSETLVHHPSIKHYVAVDVFVYRFLRDVVNLPKNTFSLIFNGVDPNKFNRKQRCGLERTTGLYVGGWNDPLRAQMFNHITQQCVENDWDLFVLGGTTRGGRYPSNIKFFDGIYNVELFMKAADFTVGLGGRTLIEGWMCGIPGYVYKVTPEGAILEITLKYPPKVERFYIENTVNKHLTLYKTIYENNI